jgi:hypothetical protein
MSSAAQDQLEKFKDLLPDALGTREGQALLGLIIAAFSALAYLWPRRDVRNLPPGPKPGFWGNRVPNHMWLYFDKLAKEYGLSERPAIIKVPHYLRLLTRPCCHCLAWLSTLHHRQHVPCRSRSYVSGMLFKKMLLF